MKDWQFYLLLAWMNVLLGKEWWHFAMAILFVALSIWTSEKRK